MTITIQALTDASEGAELGLRLFTLASPAVQVGSDIILDQDVGRDTLYAKGALSIANGEYSVDVYSTDGAGSIVGDAWAGGFLSVPADGGTYLVSEISQQLIRDALGMAAADLDSQIDAIDAELADVIKSGESQTISRTGKDPVTYTATRD